MFSFGGDVTMLQKLSCLIGAVTLSLLAAYAVAQPLDQTTPTLKNSARRVERAVLRLELFDQVEHPRAVRRLEDAITVTRARVTMHEREVAEYRQFDKVRYSKPLFLSLELARLHLVAAQTDLASLQREKRLLVQHRPQQRRLLQLELESAVDQQRHLKQRRVTATASRSTISTKSPPETRRKKRRRKPIIEARLR